MSSKKIAYIILGIAAILLLVIFCWKLAIARSENRQIMLYYANGCPHCAKVEQFMQDNKVEEKIAVIKKEVSQNQDNARALTDKAKRCGIQSASIGVPFLWANSKCYAGDENIINFFKEKLGLTAQ